MNKTDRKNKTNQILTLPTNGNYFTIKTLLADNPDFKEITLRVRVDRLIKKDKSMCVLGYRNQGKGRPEMILAMTPVTQELLDKAYNQDGIIPVETLPVVKATDVSTTPVSTTDATTVALPVDSISAPVEQAAA
jgi:hypothetical protein